MAPSSERLRGRSRYASKGAFGASNEKGAIQVLAIVVWAAVSDVQVKDIRSGVHHEDADDSSVLTDNDKLRFEEEQCQQLQRENDFLQAQLAEAS